MNTVSNRCLMAACAIGLSAAPLCAEIVEVRYDFPHTAGVALLYGYFGGDEPIEGSIISTTLVIENYMTTGSQDAADFYLTFDVPVVDAPSTQIRLLGTDLGWSGTGSFAYSFTSDDYNGEIRPGRFGAEFDGGGTFEGDAYVSFTVDTAPVPAPGSATVLIGAGLMGTRRRR